MEPLTKYTEKGVFTIFKHPTKESNVQVGGSGFAALIKDLAVPTALTYVQQNITEENVNNTIDNVKIIGNELYESLLKSVEYTKKTAKKLKRKITRKKRNTLNKTRKRKR